MRILFCSSNLDKYKQYIEFFNKYYEIILHDTNTHCMYPHIQEIDLIIDFNNTFAFHNAVLSLCYKKPIILIQKNLSLIQKETLSNLSNHFQCACILIDQICCNSIHILNYINTLKQVFTNIYLIEKIGKNSQFCNCDKQTLKSILKLEPTQTHTEFCNSDFDYYQIFFSNPNKETLTLEYKSYNCIATLQNIISIIDRISNINTYIEYK